jgi:hypothetical protein
MRGKKSQAFFAKALHFDGIDFVGSAHLVSESQSQSRDSAHSGSCHSEQMDPPRGRAS